LDAFKVVSSTISNLNNDDNSIIVITHHFKIVDYLKFDKVYVLKNGLVDREG
jgi:Fe-S cluster assembly ATP-binding protein